MHRNKREEVCRGIVVQSAGASYIVESSDASLSRCRTIPATRSDNEGATLVAVGDRVEFRPKPSETDMPEGVITRVFRRSSALLRKRDVRRNRSKERDQVIASNIDQLVVVSSADDPPLNRRLIDRYLAFAESEHLPVLVVINKMDLAEEDPVRELLLPYHRLGYRICYVSSFTDEGIEEFRTELKEKVSAFSGHSGVGKSTLINRLTGNGTLKTAETSTKTRKGVHTTSSAIMLSLPAGGYVIDTPGLREFNLSGITRENLRFYFREFLRIMPECNFSSCTHTVEPGCAVVRAAETGVIDYERYMSYLVLFGSLEPES
jgi:ribosome biogenesis GTPase